MSIFRIALVLTTLLPTMSAQNYTFQRFSVPGENATQANFINNRGAIVGHCGGKGFKRDADGVFEFPISGNLQGINDSGEITGWFLLQDGHYHGFVLTGGVHGKYTIVNVPPGPDTLIAGINDLGDFAGRTGDLSTAQWHGFVSIAGVVTQIDVPGALETQATAVAWDGTVVGYYLEQTRGIQQWYGFLRGPKGYILRFQVPLGAETLPQGINNQAGIIVGTYFDGDRNHGFVYNYVADLAALDGVSANAVRIVSAQTVDYPGRHDTYVTGVNAKGVLVGYTHQFGRPIFSFTATLQ